MRASEFIIEGGYTTTLTGGTRITPKTIGRALHILERQFIPDFNEFLDKKGIKPIKLGHPTGSSAHWEKDIDDPNAIYGDMDVQIIVPDPKDPKRVTSSSVQDYWNKLIHEFIITVGQKPYLHPQNATETERKIKRPILSLGTVDPETNKKEYMEIDFMPHREGKEAIFGRYRTTTEPGLKGKVTGKIFTALNSIFNVQIEHIGGVSYKLLNGRKIPFGQVNKQAIVKNAGTDITTLFMDLLKHEARYLKVNKIKIDPLLKQYPGIAAHEDISKIRVSDMVKGIIGLVRSMEKSGLLGKDEMSEFKTANDVIKKLLTFFNERMVKAMNAAKYSKVTDKYDIERAKKDKENLRYGTEYVNYLFANNGIGPSFKEFVNQYK